MREHEFFRSGRTKAFAGIVIGIGLGTAATAFAVFELPGRNFMAGDVLSANDLNGKFEAVSAELNRLGSELQRRDEQVVELAQQVDLLEARPVLPPGLGVPRYCGDTPPLTGNAGGYGGLKTQCEAACDDDVGAHVCTHAELQWLHAMGRPTPRREGPGRERRYAGPGALIDPYGDGVLRVAGDCAGWTSADPEGWSWDTSSADLLHGPTSCASSQPFACCTNGHP